MLFIIIRAVHVSGGLSTHNQELIELRSNPTTPAVDSRKAWQYPRLHMQFYNLLMIGGKTARNMYSVDKNKEHFISCISLVI